MPIVMRISDIDRPDVKLLGGKGLHLAEMMRGGFPVPEAFFITTDAFVRFLEFNNIRARISTILRQIIYEDPNSVKNAANEIRNLIVKGEIPNSVKQAIVNAYDEMKFNSIRLISGVTKMEEPFVSVRSSGVLEDMAKASAAGQYETFLNVRGEKELMESVKKCWASLYSERIIIYRHSHDQPQETVICVVVQRMINSEKSGVTFTIDPTDPQDGAHKIVIESVWGLGETIVQGEDDPDHYEVDKNTGRVLDKRVGKKRIRRIRDIETGKTVIDDVPEEKSDIQILTDMEILGIASYAKNIEKFYEGRPQDIEWAVENEKIYIVQTRAVTVLEKRVEEELGEVGKEILKGYGASPGVARGNVKIIRDINEIDKVAKGDILVAKMTEPGMVVSMEKAAAIVTDQGGSTSHASIVSRELGIPCIVGTGNATQTLEDGMYVTVDATHGIVYSGGVEVQKEETHHATAEHTKTEVKANVAFPEIAESVAPLADGVGLLRLEHLVAKSGVHPAEWIRKGQPEELTKIIFEGVRQVAKAFYPKPVWVRTLDIRTDEFRDLQGGENETTEANPMLGFHGIRRDLEEIDLFKAQIEAFKQLHSEGLTNVELMLPFIIKADELRKAKELARNFGLQSEVKIGIMCETPAAALSIEEFCEEGISFVSFGSNDLTQLTTGVDRGNDKLISLYDEMHPGMKFQFKHVIETCNKYGVETSICGELPSNRRDAVEFLVKAGIKSLSVNKDAIEKVREWVAETENAREGFG